MSEKMCNFARLRILLPMSNIKLSIVSTVYRTEKMEELDAKLIIL